MPTTLLAFSPTKCADDLSANLLLLADRTDLSRQDQQELMTQLIRKSIRQDFNYCAMIAEDWALHHDPASLKAERVGDCIAAAIRKAADERQNR